MNEHIAQIDILTTAVEQDAGTLFNMIGEIRRALRSGEATPQKSLNTLKDFQQKAAAIVLNLKDMQQHLEALQDEDGGDENEHYQRMEREGQFQQALRESAAFEQGLFNEGLL